MEILLSVLSLMGMSAGAWGAIRLYIADRPTSAWIQNLFKKLVERPTSGIWASDDYDPEKEKSLEQQVATEIAESVDRFSTQAKSGIAWVLFGFILQAVSQLVALVLEA